MTNWTHSTALAIHPVCLHGTNVLQTLSSFLKNTIGHLPLLSGARTVTPYGPFVVIRDISTVPECPSSVSLPAIPNTDDWSDLIFSLQFGNKLCIVIPFVSCKMCTAFQNLGMVLRNLLQKIVCFWSIRYRRFCYRPGDRKLIVGVAHYVTFITKPYLLLVC